MERVDILQGVTALIHCCEPVGLVNAKLVLKQKLESLGAKVCQRLGKETTHVVFQKRSQHEAHYNRQAEALVLLELHDKAHKASASCCWKAVATCMPVRCFKLPDDKFVKCSQTHQAAKKC